MGIAVVHHQEERSLVLLVEKLRSLAGHGTDVAGIDSTGTKVEWKTIKEIKELEIANFHKSAVDLIANDN